jgi:hypothetical protein
MVLVQPPALCKSPAWRQYVMPELHPFRWAATP